MKKYGAKLLKISGLFLCLLMLITGMQYAPVKGEELVDMSEVGGKHNGPVSVDPINQDEGYSAVLYDNTNGLPTSEANDIVQTQDGFIWIGSYAGLVRYDGSRFELTDPTTTGITSVKCLFVDSRNRLWVGTNDNGVVLVNNGQYIHWGLEDGLKSLAVRSIAEDPYGLIYVATTEGLVMIDEDLKLSYVEDLRLIDAIIHEVRVASDGRVYAVNNPGDIAVINNGKVEEFYRFSNTEVKGINCLLPDPEDPGSLYVETIDGVVYHDTLESGFLNSEPIDIEELNQVQSFEYLDGEVWVCTRNGIGVLNESGFHVVKNLPMNYSIGHVMSDYEGNLWFTSTREGVMKIVNNRFVDIFDRYHLAKRVVNSTCVYDDKLFIATDNGLIVLDEEGEVEKIALNEPVEIYDEEEETDDLIRLLQNIRIRCLIRDSKNRLWICTWRHYGLLCYENGELSSYSSADGLPSNSIRTIYECKDGRILVACNGGVSVIKNGEVIVSYTEKDGIVNTDILNVAEGENGDIIVGTDGAGIYIIDKSVKLHIDHNVGLTSDAVMRIKPDEKRGLYWIISGNSISYLDQDYQLHIVDRFPYSNNFDLYENSKGEIWVLNSNGIYIAKVDDITDGGEINTVHYTMSDGLPCIATANSYSELTESGNLYISGTTGVAKVNIEAVFEDAGELKFAVPYVDADTERIYPNEEGVFIVPARTKKLTIYCHVFTYSLVDPLITYRLDGFDEYDIVGNAAELFPIYYTNLKGGTYNLILELKYLMSGSTIGTSVQIIKEKAIYEQTWFYIYTSLSAAIVMAALLMRYEDDKVAKLEAKHKEESEKQRIANELAMGNGIQQSSIPHVFPPFPDRKEFELYAGMEPAKEVGGDFYDFFFIDDDHLCLIMADVSGKGIPGALFMMISKAILHNTAMLTSTPAKILASANDAICKDNQLQMFVTVWLGILEVSTGKLTAANAGHEYPIIKGPDGNFEILKDKHGFVMGGMEGVSYKDYELYLSKGSKIFLYTDGIPEATNSKNKMFGMDRLLNALNKDPEAGVEQIMKNVRTAVDGFVKEAEQFDDVTMMCLEYLGVQDNTNQE